MSFSHLSLNFLYLNKHHEAINSAAAVGQHHYNHTENAEKRHNTKVRAPKAMELNVLRVGGDGPGAHNSIAALLSSTGECPESGP
jgi:hypothetical protein